MIIIDEHFNENIGKRLKELRKKRNLTVAGLVDELRKYNVSVATEKTIRRWESGENAPEITNLIGLAECFNTSIDYIVCGKETSDDNSFTYYDAFKRLNRLIYSLSISTNIDVAGRVHLILLEKEFNEIYWERLQNFATNKNYDVEERNANPIVTVQDLDKLFEDFIEDKKQLLPTAERLNERGLTEEEKELLSQKLKNR